MARNVKRNILSESSAHWAGLRGAEEGEPWRKPWEKSEDWIAESTRWHNKKQESSGLFGDRQSEQEGRSARSRSKPEYRDRGTWEQTGSDDRSRDFRADSSDEIFDFGGSHVGSGKRGGNVGLSVLIGLAGGLAATFIMTQAQNAMQKAQPAQSQRPKSKEQQQKEVSEQSTVKLADKVSRSVTNHEVPQEQKQTAGNTVHYTFGTLMGGVYGALASTLNDAPLGTGVLFGIGLWLAADGFLLPYLGLSKPPQHKDLKEHAYEASAHAVYGLTLDAVNQLRKRVA